MTDIQKTIKELTDIITYLKTKTDSATTYANPAEKTAWEKRINDLKTNNSTHELSLIGLTEFATNLGKQITDLIKDKTELAAQKSLVETERDDKQAIITTKESELTQKEAELQAKITEITGLTEAKLTKDLIDKINALSTNPTNLTEIKTSLAEMTKNFQEIKKVNEKLAIFTYFGLGTSIFTGLVILYQAFFPSKKKVRKEEEFEEE